MNRLCSLVSSAFSARPRSGGGPVATLAADARFVLLATLGAFAVRIAYYLWLGPMDWSDTSTYLQAGRDLVAGRTIESDIVMPLYPLMLVITGWRGVVWLQLLLSALEVPLVYLLGQALFGRRAIARWCAVLMAVEPLSIFYASQRLTETSFTFLVCLALVALYYGRLWSASIVLAVSVLIRPTLDPLAPVLMLVFGALHATGRKPAAAVRAVATYALVYALVMAPWWVHNAMKYDRFVRLNLGDGIVLRVEHNPLFVQWGFWSKLGPVFEEFSDEPDPVRRNALRREAALGFVVEDPARYVTMAARRLLRFWSPVADQDENAWFPARARPLFSVATLLLYAGVLAYALQKRRRKWRRILPLLLVVGYLTAVHTAMHAVVRYRAPLMPLVVLIAGAGWQRFASGASMRLGSITGHSRTGPFRSGSRTTAHETGKASAASGDPGSSPTV